MATLFNRQLGNMRGQKIRNVGKPMEATDAMTWGAPDYTTAERDQIDAINGMIIYNTTLNKFQGYENGSWVNFT